jgi:hypothetical protein
MLLNGILEQLQSLRNKAMQRVSYSPPLISMSGRLFKRIMSGSEFVRGQRDFIGAQLPG